MPTSVAGSPLWPALASAADQLKAEQWMQTALVNPATDIYTAFGPALPGIGALAMANQFYFAIEEEDYATITPRHVFDTEGRVCDQSIPIESLLAAGSDESGTSYWNIPGFASGFDLAVDLLARGFIWDPAFQAAAASAASAALVQPLVDQRAALAASLAAPKPGP